MTRHFHCPHAAGENLQPSKQCSLDQSYSSIQKINEHLAKVHSLNYVCTEKAVPTTTEGASNELRMAEEQQRRWMDWRTMTVPAFVGERTAEMSWRRIDKRSYPDALPFPPITVSTGHNQLSNFDVRKQTIHRPESRAYSRCELQRSGSGISKSTSSQQQRQSLNPSPSLRKCEEPMDPHNHDASGTKYPPRSLSAHSNFNKRLTSKSSKSIESIPSLVSDTTRNASPCPELPDVYRSFAKPSTGVSLVQFRDLQKMSHHEFVQTFSQTLTSRLGTPTCMAIEPCPADLESLQQHLEMELETFFMKTHHSSHVASAMLEYGTSHNLRKEIVVQVILWLKRLSANRETTGHSVPNDRKATGAIARSEDFGNRAHSSVPSWSEVWLDTHSGHQRLRRGFARYSLSQSPQPKPVFIEASEHGELTETDFLNIHTKSANQQEIIELWRSHAAFEPLITKCRTLVERYYLSKPQLISCRILTALRRDAVSIHNAARFYVDWDIVEFLRCNYPNGLYQDLGQVLCFIGNLENAQVTTVADYLESVWPQSSHTLLDAINQFCIQADSNPKAHTRFTTASEGNSISVRQMGRRFLFQGSEDFIVAMGQQLAFLALACRTTPGKTVCSYLDFVTKAKAEFGSRRQTTTTNDFQIYVRSESAARGGMKSCWNALIGHSVLVAGYPIPLRPESITGLESQIGILSSLIGIRQAQTYRGGYVLKGRFHALVPIETQEEVVRWHLIDSSPEKLAWSDIDRHCHRRILGTDSKDFEALQSSRAILGWCGEVENILGTHHFAYSRVQYSKAKLGSPTRLEASELTIGVTHIIQATTKFTLSRKDGVSTRQRSDFYENLLEDASDLNIFIYDTETKRAFYTNGERFILQCILQAHHNESRSVDCKTGTLEPIAPKDDVRQAMISKAHIPLRKGILMSQSRSGGTLYFKDKVLEYFERLDRMQAHSSEQPPLSVSVEVSTYLHGWEYLEFVRSPRQMNVKRVKLLNSSGSWPFFAKDPKINGIIMIGQGFGELLRPTKDTCPLYRSIPTGRDYLGIEVSLLAAMYEENGSSGDQERLTSTGWAWHRPGLLFEPCLSQYSSETRATCHCDRIQDFHAPSTTGFSKLWKARLRPPGQLESKGAAIFGLPRVKNSKITRISGSPAIVKELAHPLSMSSCMATSLETLKSAATSCPSNFSDGFDFDDQSTAVPQYTPTSSVISGFDASRSTSMVCLSDASSTVVNPTPNGKLLHTLLEGDEEETSCTSFLSRLAKPTNDHITGLNFQNAHQMNFKHSRGICGLEGEGCKVKQKPPLRRKKGYECFKQAL